jgi:tyrosine-protein phosphatase SIW14
LFLFVRQANGQTASTSQISFQRPDTWAKKIDSTSLSNFYKIDSLVFRSKQPDHNGMLQAQSMGIKTVLNLRHIRNDRWKARNTLLKLNHLAINSWKISYSELVIATAFLVKSKNPVLVHCWHGSDRTGCIIACYRMVKQGWSKQQAIDEMLNGGYGFHQKRFAYIPVLLQSIDLEKFRTDIESCQTILVDVKPAPNYLKRFFLYLTDLKDWNLD